MIKIGQPYKSLSRKHFKTTACIIGLVVEQFFAYTIADTRANFFSPAILAFSSASTDEG